VAGNGAENDGNSDVEPGSSGPAGIDRRDGAGARIWGDGGAGTLGGGASVD